MKFKVNEYYFYKDDYESYFFKVDDLLQIKESELPGQVGDHVYVMYDLNGMPFIGNTQFMAQHSRPASKAEARWLRLLYGP